MVSSWMNQREELRVFILKKDGWYVYMFFYFTNGFFLVMNKLIKLYNRLNYIIIL